MADAKISELADGGAIQATDEVPANRGGSNVKVTVAPAASAVSVLDTAGNFTGTDVEAVLAELQDNIDAGGGGGAAVDDVSLIVHMEVFA